MGHGGAGRDGARRGLVGLCLTRLGLAWLGLARLGCRVLSVAFQHDRVVVVRFVGYGVSVFLSAELGRAAGWRSLVDSWRAKDLGSCHKGIQSMVVHSS